MLISNNRIAHRLTGPNPEALHVLVATLPLSFVGLVTTPIPAFFHTVGAIDADALEPTEASGPAIEGVPTFEQLLSSQGLMLR